MKFIINTIKIFIILGIICAGCLYYAFEIEPYSLKVDTIDINIDKENGENVKIVQFSDTHIKENYTADELVKIVDKINSIEPDIVIFTGDLYDNYSIYNDDENIIEELSKIKVNIEKIAINGNRDYGSNAIKNYTYVMESSGFLLLNNQNLILNTNNNKKILFTGIDDSLLGNPQMPTTNYDDIDYKIFLTHEPDIIENYPVENYDLILAGHTHGGQIGIPIINDLAMQESGLGSKYKSGLTELEIKNNPTLYINTGLGTTHISARFLVPPTITLFNINI